MEPILLLILFGPPLFSAWIGAALLWKGFWLDERTLWLDTKGLCAALGLRVERASDWKPPVRRWQIVLLIVGALFLLASIRDFIAHHSVLKMLLS